MRDTLAKVRKKDREALAQDLKGIWRADTVKQAHRALRALGGEVGREIPGACGQVVGQTARPEFLNHPKGIRAYLYGVGPGERAALGKETARVCRNAVGKRDLL